MTIFKTGIYHIYNRGNNQQPIFFKEDNYFYFLRKCHRYLKPCSEIFAWCLMPNHFHFLIEVTEKSLEPIKIGGNTMALITNGFRLLQSSYAKGINNQLNRTGNLCQQKAKAKFIDESEKYSIKAFHYIHQNPVAGGLVKEAHDWPYSSFIDYSGIRNGNLCNKIRATELLQLSDVDIKIGVGNNFGEDIIEKIY